MLNHAQKVKEIQKQIKKFYKQKKKVRIYHGSTNSTRSQKFNDELIDISGLNQIIEVNSKEKYVVVEPNVSMDRLIDETLKYGLIPPVVMEFPGITTGGGVNGAALESSSYKYGQFCDICSEYEILLADGSVIKATATKNKDIFYGISGSYGSLGLVTLIKIKLISASPYVHLKFYPVKGYKDSLEFLKNEILRRETDYLEGIIFKDQKGIIIMGKLSGRINLPIKTYTKAKDLWFYERAKKISEKDRLYEELVPIKDYLFRYNRGAFWTGEHIFSIFRIPRNRISKFILNPFMNTRKLYDGLHALNISQEFFIQDFLCPYSQTFRFLNFSENELEIFPIWLCPIRPTKTPQKLSPNYIKTNLLIDIGIWGRNKKYLTNPIMFNRNFENFAKKNSSKKMLYAHAYYSKDEFWKIYDKDWYENLRRKYSADIFPNIWEKTHVSKKYKVHKFRGIFKMILDSLRGRHLNS